jgi:hypothetical protein
MSLLDEEKYVRSIIENTEIWVKDSEHLDDSRAVWDFQINNCTNFTVNPYFSSSVMTFTPVNVTAPTRILTALWKNPQSCSVAKRAF